MVDRLTRLPVADGLWRLTMEHSPVGMALLSPDGEFLTANVALCDMLGYGREAMEAMSFRDITHPDDLETDTRLAEQALAGEISSYRITKRYVRADGSVLVGDLSVALLRDDDGTPIHFISQIADLSERQAFAERLDAAEETTHELRSKSEAILASVSVGLLLVDADGTYSAWNHRQQELLDIAFPDGHDGRAGQPGFVYDADQQAELSFDQFPCARATEGDGEEFDDLLIWIGREPTTRRALSVSARSVRDREGTLTGAVLAYHDVTDMLLASAVKDEFVRSVSHELRTPLTSALAYLELLDDSPAVTDDVRQQVAAARRNMMRLSHLVADLLFAARAGSGSPVVDPYRLDVVRVVAEAVDAAQVDAAGRQVELAADLPESLVVVADGLRLRQALDNVLANAITWAQRGGVVEVSLVAGERAVEITVTDDGEGLEEAELKEMFGLFFRGHNARSRHVPGAGLGLSIVRTIVEAHGGEVSAASAPGRGTSVRVVLPR